MARLPFLPLFITFFCTFISGVLSGSFTLTNNCAYTVWPGLLSNAGSTPLSTTGFSLQKGESKTLSAPSGWAGRFWGRTICNEDSSGKFSCVTGDCGSGKLECAGSGAAPPATLAQFKLDGANGLDFYDVSLVDGYNLPMLVVPQGGSGNCSVTGCLVDLNEGCPSDLRVLGEDGSENVACKSACEAFGDPQYCCSGAYGNPNTCKPSTYSQFFKHACPRAYSYAYDDGTSTFTCASADYVITFCPPISTSQKASSSNSSHPQAADPLPLVNSSTVFMGGEGLTRRAEPQAGYSRLLSISVVLVLVLLAVVLLALILQKRLPTLPTASCATPIDLSCF